MSEKIFEMTDLELMDWVIKHSLFLYISRFYIKTG